MDKITPPRHNIFFTNSLMPIPNYNSSPMTVPVIDIGVEGLLCRFYSPYKNILRLDIYFLRAKNK